MADFLFSVGADLSQLATDLNRLRELAAGITLPTGLDRGINQATNSLRDLNTTASGTPTAMGRATQGITGAGQAAEQAAARTAKWYRQQADVIKLMDRLGQSRVGDLGIPQAIGTIQRMARLLDDIDRGLIRNKKNATGTEWGEYKKAAAEAEVALKRLGQTGLQQAAGMKKNAEDAVRATQAQAKAAQDLGKIQSAAAAEDVRRTEAQAKAVQNLGKLQSAAVAEDAKRVQASGRLHAQALKENGDRLTHAQNQATKLRKQLESLQGITFGAPKGTDTHIQTLLDTIERINKIGPIARRELNSITAESERLNKSKGAASVFNDLGTSMLRAIKVGAQFTLIYGALRAAIGGVQELVALDKQMTNIASTITDTGQRAKTLPVAFDLTREAMTTLGLSAEKAGGLVFELQKVFDGNAELMRAAFIPALVLTANKEADQAETVRVLVGAYNLYGDTLQGAATAQEKFTKLSDMLLKSSFLSVASVQDLATALGSVAATGKQSGVSFSQLLGTLVVLQDSLRKSGQSGAGLNRTFEALLENAQNAANIFDVPFDVDRGVKPFELLLEVLEQINREVAKTGTPTERLAQKISQAFPTIQSRQTILTLAGQTDKIREVAKEAEAAAGVTTTAFGEMQKALGAAASALFNEFLTAFANVLSAIGGDAPGKFEGIANAIRTIADAAREAGDSLATVIKGLNLVVSVGAGVIDVAKGAGEAASGALTGNADRSAQGGKRISGTGRGLLGKIRALGLDPFDPDIATRTEIGREWEAEFRRRQNERELKGMIGFGPERLGPFLDAQGANTNRIIQETAEQPSERIRRLTNDAVNEIFEEAQRNDPTRTLPDRLQDALNQQQKSEAALRQGKAAPGKLGKDEATQITAIKTLARDAAEDQKRVFALRREIADFDARNFVENMKRQEELFQSQLKFNDEIRLRTIETLPGGAEDKFTARLDAETQAEIDEVEKRVKTQDDYANAVVAIMAIRDEKLRQFRIANENAELESIKRQVDAFNAATDTELQAQARALSERIKQSVSTAQLLAGDSGFSPADELETIQKVLNKEFGLDKLQVDLEVTAATFGKFGEEAIEASLSTRLLRKEFLDLLPPGTEQKLRELIPTLAKLTAENKRLETTLALVAAGFDKATASAIAMRNEAEDVRIGNLERATAELKKFNESAERSRDVMTELSKQTARFEGDAVGFFFASLKKSADETGGFFKGLEDLATDTARNMQSSFSDLFFDVFTNNAQSAGEVFKNFIHSMLRSVSNFLANQLVQQLLGLLFPGQGPQQLAGPTGFSLSGILGSVKELFNGTGVAGTTVAQGPEQLAGPGFEGGAAATLPTSSGATGLGGLLAALPAIGASASALGGMLGEEGASLRKFGSLAASLGGAATLLRGIQTGNLLTGGAGIASIAGGVIGATGIGGQTGQLAGNALSSLGLLAGGPGSTLAGGLMVGNTLINAYRSFSDPNANQGTGIGGVAGTAVGGAIGAYLSNGSVEGTVQGAAIGGAIGEFIGSFFGKEGLSHSDREDREVAATIDVAIAFQKAIQGATSAADLFRVLVEGTVDSDGRGDDTPIVSRVNGTDIRELSAEQLIKIVEANAEALKVDIIAGVAPEKLADAERQLEETIRSMVTAMKAVQTGLARFGEVAINLTKDSGTLLDLEEIKGPFEAMREEIHDIDVELADALRNVSGLPQNMDEILALVNKRYQVELDFLREVNDAVKAIRESIADQRTDIELQFATPAERVKIIQRQLDDVLNSLRLATDPKEIASLTQEGQGLVRDLLGQSDSLSNDFGLTQPAIKQTALHLLNQLEELSTLRLGDLSEAARDGDKEFVDFLLDSAQKMGLELNLTTEQLQGLAYNAARASEALIRLGVGPAGQSPLGFARGGLVPGTGSGDTVPALLEPGEFVLPRAMASMFRSMGALEFAEGGLVPSFSSRMFGNNNLQGFGNFYSNLSTMQQIAGPLQLALQIAGLFGGVPGGSSWLTGAALRKTGLLPTYNTGSFMGDMFNPYSDRGIFQLFGDLGRDIGTSLFGTSDRFATGPSGAGGLSDVLRSGMGGGFSGLDTSFSGPTPGAPFFTPGTGEGLVGGAFTPTRSTPAYAPTLSSYFSQGFGDISVSGSGSAYPYGSTPSPFGGSSKSVGGISDPYAFNIPWGASPLTAQALGFAPWQMYEGAIADRALATGSLFGSSFSASYGAMSPYNIPAQNWMGPGVTGNTFNPYRFSPLPTTIFNGIAYQPTGQQFTGMVTQGGNFASYSPSTYGGYYGGSSSLLRGYAEGGFVGGSGTGDIVPALLTPGEYVVPAGVAAANKTLLESLSSTGFGTPSTTTASGARNTMTRAAGTALGSLSKGISGTLIKAGTNAANQLGDASDQVADALASATLMAMGTAMRGLVTSLNSEALLPGVIPSSLPGGPSPAASTPTAATSPTGPFSLEKSWMIPGLAMPTQETVDRLNAMFGGGSAPPPYPMNVITPDMLRFLAGAGFSGGGFIGGPPGFDNVPIWASAGEFVVPRYAAMANAGALEHLREHGTLPGGQNVMFNLHFAITGATDPAAVAEAVEKKIEASVRTGRLGVVIAERQKRKV